MQRLTIISIGAAISLGAGVLLVSMPGHQPDPPSWRITPHQVIVGGDVMLDRDVERWILNGNDPFADIAPLLREAGTVIANLESPLTQASVPLDKPITFRADPRFVSYLANGGISDVTLANNHIGDFGPAGLFETIRTLTAAGIGHVGAGNNIDAATAPLVKDVDGQRIAFVNFSQYSGASSPAATKTDPGQAFFRDEDLAAAIARAREQADIVIVILHFGEEFAEYPTFVQQGKARFAIDMGADAVIGHHPHVTQGIENYRGKPIFYSIGNLVFDQESKPWDRSFLVAIDRNSDGSLRYTLYPYRIVKTTPQFMSDSEAKEFLTTINALSPEPLIKIGDGKGTLRIDPWFGELTFE